MPVKGYMVTTVTVTVYGLGAEVPLPPLHSYRLGLMFRFTPRTSSVSTMVQLLAGSNGLDPMGIPEDL